MRSCIWKTSLLLAVTMAAPAFARSVVHAKTHNQLVGTWEVQVTQVDCQSGTPLGPPFTSLLTFTEGKALFEDTENPFFAHGQRGGGQGAWSATGESTYSAMSVALIKYTTEPNQKTNNPGFEAGQQTISQNITLNAGTGQWTSTASVSFADTTGKVYRQGCATASAVPY